MKAGLPNVGPLRLDHVAGEQENRTVINILKLEVLQFILES